MFRLDIKSYIGEDPVFIKATEKYKYNSKDVIGTNINVFSSELMTTFNVVIPGKLPKDFKHIQKRSVIEFENLEVILYIIDGKPVISRKATDVNIVLEQTMEDLLLSVDKEY